MPRAVVPHMLSFAGETMLTDIAHLTVIFDVVWTTNQREKRECSRACNTLPSSTDRSEPHDVTGYVIRVIPKSYQNLLKFANPNVKLNSNFHPCPVLVL
jgi:hypothetical protein